MKKYILVFITLVFIFNSANIVWAYNYQAVDAYNNGIENARNKQYDKAIEMFKQAIELDPTLLDALYNMSSVYEYVGNIDKAIELLEIYLRKKSNDSEVAFRLAKLYFSRQNYSKSLIYLSSIPVKSENYKESQALAKIIKDKYQAQNAVNDKKKNKVVETRVYKDFQGPTGVAEDSKGNIYIAQYTNNSIIKVSFDGKRTVFFQGKPLGGPIGLVIDKFDNVYVANYILDSVIKISQDGKINTVLSDIKSPYFLYLNDLGILHVSVQGDNSLIRLDINSI